MYKLPYIVSLKGVLIVDHEVVGVYKIKSEKRKRTER